MSDSGSYVSSIQTTLAKLVTTIDANHIGCSTAILLRRPGRFQLAAGPSEASGNPISVDASTIDDITSPRVIDDVTTHAGLAPVATAMGVSSLWVWPVRSSSANNVAFILLGWPTVTQPTDTQRTVLDSIAQTIAIVLETADSLETFDSTTLHDSLTHLPNRAMLVDKLSNEMSTARRTGARLGVFTLDLDKFTAINERYGKQFGDRLLQKLASRLHHRSRRPDFVARLGEDEFVVIGTLTDQPEAAHIAAALLDIVKTPVVVDGISFTPASCIGISIFPHDGADVETLLKNAMTAVHRAKLRGVNQFEYFTPQMNEEAMQRLVLETDLKLAIDKNQLLLNYQPVVDCDRQVLGVEALVRWQHPEMGMISPAKFIPIAEQTGQIIQIGNWVLREACRQGNAWIKDGYCIRMNVNVSMLQFAKDDFEQQVIDILKETELPPGMLELELTESLFMVDQQQIVAKLARLRGMGVRVAIDDFGAGYSSLSRIHALPIDTLKIDRSFVQEVTENQGNTDLHQRSAVLRAMVSLGRHLGLRLVAEGIETESQYLFVKRLGYDSLQGYLFSKPVLAEKIPGLVEAAQQALHPPAMRRAA